MMKLKAAALRLSQSDPEIQKNLQKNPIYIIVDNVLDTYNIGAIFRLADAVAAEKVYLCAGSETPPNHRIKKASINTTEWVSWEYHASTIDAIKDVRSKIQDIQIIAVEQDPRSVPYTQFDFQLPVALVVGHETDGVAKEVMDACDATVELPMFGINVSLNVMVSLGITLYEVIRQTGLKIADYR